MRYRIIKKKDVLISIFSDKNISFYQHIELRGHFLIANGHDKYMRRIDNDSLRFSDIIIRPTHFHANKICMLNSAKVGENNPHSVSSIFTQRHHCSTPIFMYLPEFNFFFFCYYCFKLSYFSFLTIYPSRKNSSIRNFLFGRQWCYNTSNKLFFPRV